MSAISLQLFCKRHEEDNNAKIIVWLDVGLMNAEGKKE